MTEELKPLFTVENFEPTHQCMATENCSWIDCVFNHEIDGPYYVCTVRDEGERSGLHTTTYKYLRPIPKVTKRPWTDHELMSWQWYYKNIHNNSKVSLWHEHGNYLNFCSSNGGEEMIVKDFCKHFVAVDSTGKEHELYKEVEQ